MDSIQTEQERVRSEIDQLSASVSDRKEVDLLDLLIVLAKRKKLILEIAAVLTAAAVLAAFLLPNRYNATVVIIPPQQPASTASLLMSQLGGLGSLASLAGKDLGLKANADLYIGMLRSRSVQDAVVAQFNMQSVYRAKLLSDARRRLDRATEIVSGKDGMISVSFEDTDGTRAASVANAYVSELKKLTQHLAVTEASQRRLFFEQQLQQAKQDLADAEVAMKEMEQKTGLVHLDSQARAIIDAVGRLRAEMAAREVELHAMRSFATNQNPQVVLRERELEGLRSQLSQLEQQQNSTVAGDPIIATGKMPAYGLEYVRRLREVKYRETLFELLAKQFEAAKLDEAREAAVIQVVDPAVPPDKRSSPKRAMIVAFALVLGVILGSLCSLALEWFDRLQVSDPEKAGRIAAFRHSLATRPWSS